MSGDLVRASDIMVHLGKKATVASDLALEDVAAEKARWEAGDHPDDKKVAAAYEAFSAAGNERLIDLAKAVEGGGTYEMSSFLPKMAIAPATTHLLHCTTKPNGDVLYWVRQRNGLGRWSEEFMFPAIRENYRNTYKDNRPTRFKATARVPHLPPEVRKIATRRHLIIWEPTWRTRKAQKTTQPTDPALLERVAGHLYRVVASWELSELEMAALRG